MVIGTVLAVVFVLSLMTIINDEDYFFDRILRPVVFALMPVVLVGTVILIVVALTRP